MAEAAGLSKSTVHYLQTARRQFQHAKIYHNNNSTC